MTISVKTEKVGSRIYVVGNTYPIKDQLKAAGCHWDGDRKQWWIGAAKAAAIDAIVGKVDGQDVPEPKKDLGSKEVHGKVEYKGRTYYVICESKDGGRLWLTVLDASIDFWADAAACQWIKRYEARERFAGYGRGTVREYQTLGGIRRYVERMKNDKGFREQEEDRQAVSACGRRDCRRLEGKFCSDCHDEE